MDTAQKQVRSPKFMILVLMLGAFIGLFGETALNMALTNLMEQFSIEASTAQWLVTGYLLVMAIFVPISVFLIKWFDTRQLVLSGLIISLIGAIIGAIAPSFIMLLIGRIVQAIGTGILLPVMMNIALLIFPAYKRGKVMGLMGLVITLAPALGPTLSGVIISTLNWHFIFWFSAIGYVLLIIMALSVVENIGDLTKPYIDFVSIVLSSVGFGGFIYALATMADRPFTDWQILAPFIVGIVALLLFSLRQFKLPQPMINLRVFQYKMFTLGTIMAFLSLVTILATAILLPLYLKGALLFAAAAAGLILLPGNLLNVLLAPIVGALFDKYGPRPFLFGGTIIMTLGNMMFLFTISTETATWQIIIAFMLLCFGLSCVMMPSQTNALNQLPRELYADGSAVMNTLNQVGGAVGTAVAITIYTASLHTFIQLNPIANPASPVAIAYGVQYTFYIITAISVILFICSLFVKNSLKLKS
ncbi:lincomycin resistance protein LmrB [Lysinibacillus alkalisoli]|uniref:Lincomycin resistance protein LmrB n=1 Tax=Lysinibacillus alkalisoli TaxID=1911548 RepID=A0A917LEI5_9BACI|nr:DHA2 family efflux MFS transporter permease subunit [Lysinibacillus alkalisoli]GGG16192.1 lincomycin resistance protein LmrB [Lysinibacillus alkalisoli]